MDEFGVLVESIGFKSHGKSAPMAELKPKPKRHSTADSSINTSPLNVSSSLPVDDLDGIFRSNFNINKTGQSQNLFGEDDTFGGPVSSSNQFGGIDLESVLNSSSNKTNDNDSNSRNSVGSNGYAYDLLGSQWKQNACNSDLFGSAGVDSSERQENEGSGFEDLIPGFGVATVSNQGVQSENDLSPESNGPSFKSRSTLEDDPFLVFESSISQSDAAWSFAGPSEQDTGQDSIQSSFDELDTFAMGRGQNDSRVDGKINKPSAGLASNRFENVDDLDTFFGGGVQQTSAARPTSTTQDSQFGFFFGEEKGPEVKQTSSWSSFSKKKTSPETNIGDDFNALFGDVVTSSGEFHEIEGEPEERRRARLNRHIRTNARVAEALSEKNQRDLQSQHEQEEKHRLAETLDNDIKNWAAGKEGNLRALLSSLQQVLWPECGWSAVSLTDLITSDSVKKVYKKAALYIHPDKVQQKGANLQQKYVAEKVFDLLKEAWIKFSAEELR